MDLHPLDITVIDPACGSAAFLIAAVDRLALRLAEIRRDGRPDDRDLRHARRDVLQHCIYGVDKDETAVELAKVALWIHCAVEDRPLTFLDHRIQQGDSLVGWPLLGQLPRAIPDEAYEPRPGDSKDDKAARRGWVARNRGQLELGETTPPAPRVAIDLPELVDAPEASPDDVHAKAAAYNAWRESAEVSRLEDAANTWAAAFFWSREVGHAPTSQEYWAALRGQDISQTAEVDRLAAEVPFFHWALRFPEIRSRGGFDCVIGNPPWSQFESREQEWFASRAPVIASLKGNERKAAIARLAEEQPELHSRWRRYVTTNDRMAEWTRESGRFTPPDGKPNTYMFFAEHATDILRSSGRAGVLVKSALATDVSAKPLFERLVAEGRVEEFHDVINGARGSAPIFPNVAAVERFAVVALTGPGDRDGFEATAMNRSVEEAATRMPRRLTRHILRTLNPRTRSLTSFRLNEQLEVAIGIHGRLSTLDFDGGANPWDLRYSTLFNPTTASKQFLKREELEPDEWKLGRDKIFRRRDVVALPLYEGQLANRYDHRARTYEGYTGPNKYGRKPGIPQTTDEQKADPTFEIESRYWMLGDNVEVRLDQRVGDRVMVGFRDVGAPWTNQRSAKAAILPRVPATDKLPILAIPRELAFEFLGLFNASVFDFLVRGHMPGAEVGAKWMLAQVAAPLPGLDARVAANAERLSLTSNSVAELFGVEAHRWDPDERYALDVETDALVALGYGIDQEEYEIVLDSFEVMERDQVKRYGHNRFRAECLTAFDRLAADAPEEATVGST